MRGFATFLTGCVLATAALGQDAPPPGPTPSPPPGAGPRGTSGEVHDDSVGYAALLRVSAGTAPTVRIAAMHPTLPTGSFIEVTALDTGRTIAAMVVGPYRGEEVVALSPDAAQALGIGEHSAVRVRAVTPSPQDQAALRTGQAAGSRLDAPPALLVALRKKLPGQAASHPPQPPRTLPGRMTPPAGPLPRRSPPPPPPLRTEQPPTRTPRERGAYGVQVATLSSPERAAALAQMLGGRVVSGGGLYRVQLGPFADPASAAHARDAAARQGYRDARIFHSE